MRSPDKPHFSAHTRRQTEIFQVTTGAIGRAATWVAAGSSSPNYQQQSWQSADAAAVAERSWIDLPGNSQAGLLMRLWKTAYVLSMNRDEYRSIVALHPDAHPAVAIKTDDHVQIGTSPGMCFGSLSKDLCAVAGREGRGPTTVSAGLWVPEHEMLVVPSSLAEYKTHVPLEQFAEPELRTVPIV